MRIFPTIALLLTSAVTPAWAIPFSADARCPNVNAAASSLQQKEAAAPQDEPDDYIAMAQAYQQCMQTYAKAGNDWQTFYAGTQAMQWAWGGALQLKDTNVQEAQTGYALVHSVYTFLDQRGIAYAQYGDQWQAMDAAARKELGLK